REVGDDQPAEHDAEDRPDGPAERGEPVGAAAPIAGVEVGYYRTTIGHDQRAADALDDPEDDDRRLVPGQRAQQRADHEDREAGLVHPDPAEHVPQPAHLGGEQRDDQQEADDHPDHV